MYDPGLKSYQDIIVPEYKTDDRLPPDEWNYQLRKALIKIFDHVLTIQDEMGIQLHFEYTPIISGVVICTYNEDGVWLTTLGEENDIRHIVSFQDHDLWAEDYDDPGEWANKVIEKVNNWADDFYERNN